MRASGQALGPSESACSGSRMRFHEYAGDARRDGGAGQHRNELALAAGGAALPAGQLHRMGGIEHHRTAGRAHDRQRAHVGDQIVVAEGKAALADHDGVIAGAARLVDHVAHLPGREELALLDIDRLALRRHADDEIGLAAQEGRGLQHINHRGDFRQRSVLMHIGEHRHLESLADRLQHLQARFQAGSAIAAPEERLALSKEALKIKGMPSLAVISTSVPAISLRERRALDDARTCDQKQRLISTYTMPGELHAPAAAGSCEAR